MKKVNEVREIFYTKKSSDQNKIYGSTPLNSINKRDK